ncbi:MAG: PAS domain S-box protein [Pseudomonadota bacterium]
MTDTPTQHPTTDTDQMADPSGDRLEMAILDAVFHAAVDAILVADANGTIIRVNRAAADMFGFAPDEMVGRPLEMIMPPHYAHAHQGYMSHHMTTGERRIIDIGRDVEARHRDGRVFPVNLSVGRADLDTGAIFVGVLHDLTDRFAAQEALSRSQRLDAVGQMTGGIAHDFNNLLTVIIGNLELMQLKSTSTDGPLIADALEAAELGAELTARLLTFARKSPLAPQSLSLAERCDETVRMLERILGAPYSILCHHAEDQPRVKLDPAQLQTALLNMALNARDAMPDGGSLILQTEPVQIDDDYIAQEIDIAPGAYLRLSISDTGSGMSESAQKQAFEPFFTTKPAGKGTGLGLSMVYGFVRQSGGHVTLYSEEGKGSTFALYFPIESEDLASSAVVTPESEPERGRGQVILVVEDDEKVRRLSMGRIKGLGYVPLEACDAQQALDLLDDFGQVDLLFTDIAMPGSMTGYDLARHVTERYPDMPILLTSGYAKQMILPDAEKPPYPILRKPYRVLDLARALGAALARQAVSTSEAKL